MSKTRQEKDSLGTVTVPADKYWGAQTERALKHFAIGEEKMPLSLIKTIAMIKKSAAKVNAELSVVPKSKAQWIIKAANEIMAGKLDHHFPISVWQTGSGTQTNMNVNEVIANRASELAGHGKGLKRSIHPNDHVNHSQSTNDLFPTAMHVTVVQAITHDLLPVLKTMRDELSKKQRAFKNQIKIGRTHLQDAVPMTVGQEFSAYVAQLDANIKRIKQTLPGLYELPIGGTAIGTGLNAPKQFDKKIVKEIAAETKLPFKVAPNKFALMAAHDEFVFLSGALKTLAVGLMKLANDIRWLSSGPHCGLGELILPANEPGSSIMPGKVNPTQCEAMMMVGMQVIGNDTAITLAGSQGEFQLNVFKPIVIHNILQSITLLKEASVSFAHYLLKGLTVNKARLKYNVDHSLMRATALTKMIGYDKAAKIVQYASQHQLSLRDACIQCGDLSASQFDACGVNDV